MGGGAPAGSPCLCGSIGPHLYDPPAHAAHVTPDSHRPTHPHIAPHPFAIGQDFAAVGVAVPDKLQFYRVQKLKDMGGNGWRTAHNPPNPGLLDACDTLGTLVWDENHRNGEDAQVPLLVRRDRNHPSVVIWSIW